MNAIEYARNHEKTHCANGFHSTVAVAARSVCWQRLCGTHLRNRLVAIAGAGDWSIGDFIGCAARNVYGWDVPGKSPVPAVDIGRTASFDCLQRIGDRHCSLRPIDSHRHALRRHPVWCDRGLWLLGNCASGRHLYRLFDAAHAPDGRDAACDCAMGAHNAKGNLMARVFLWRQYRRSGTGLRAGGILSLAGLRYGSGDVRRRLDQRLRRGGRFPHGEVDAVLCCGSRF